MISPRFAAITISLDTEKHRARRPDERRETIYYLVDRLFGGEEVAQEALEHYGLKAAIREAFKKEIIDDQA